MKKIRRKFNIVKWNENKRKFNRDFCKNAKFIAAHPLTWMLIIITIVYGFNL